MCAKKIALIGRVTGHVKTPELSHKGKGTSVEGTDGTQTGYVVIELFMGALMSTVKLIRVEVVNEILGDSIFWEGLPENVMDIRNIIAKKLAKQVAKDGQSRSLGMWRVSAIVK